MKKDILYDTGGLIYPGGYVPLLSEEEVESALKNSPKDETVFPLVNVTELANLYKIELAVPGVKREEFLIKAEGNTLSVIAVHKDFGLHEKESIQLHEFNNEYFKRHIILPDNADSDFISAEYCAGILCIYVPKAKQSAQNPHTIIAVY
jgi:HSP20 family protein